MINCTWLFVVKHFIVISIGSLGVGSSSSIFDLQKLCIYD